jgi:hypothetical protein
MTATAASPATTAATPVVKKRRREIASDIKPSLFEHAAVPDGLTARGQSEGKTRSRRASSTAPTGIEPQATSDGYRALFEKLAAAGLN